MGRSRRDGAAWARVARRGGTDPLEAGQDAQYLTVDPDSGALVVTGAGTAPTATALRVQDGDSTRTALVGDDRALLVRDVTAAEAKVASAQEPAALMAAGEVFTGPWEDVLPYAAISVAIFTDQPSATQGAVVEFSEDGLDVIRAVPTTIPANFQAYFSLAPEARFVRFRYTNGPTAQTLLRVQVLYRFQPPAIVEQPLAAALTDANLATVTRAVLAARDDAGTYGPLRRDATGRLLVDVEDTAALTDAQLRASSVLVSGPLTDAQLRATPVPVATELEAAGPLATEVTLAAIPPLIDAVEQLLTFIRDEQYRRTDPLPPGTNTIGHVVTEVQSVDVYVLPSGTRTVNGESAALLVSGLTRVAFDVNVTTVAGTLSPAMTLHVDRMGADGIWYTIYSSPSITAARQVSTSIGQGMTVGQSLAAQLRVRWVITGTAPGFTFSASLVGK